MSRQDPTSQDERIYAYMLDLEHGIGRAHEMWPQTNTAALIEAQATTEFPKPWVKVLSQPDTQQLFSLIEGSVEMTDENLMSTLKAINIAFEDVY